MADRTFFTTIARQVADAASDIEGSVSGGSIGSHASRASHGSGSGSHSSGSSIVSGSGPASVASSHLSGPAQTQALLGSPSQAIIAPPVVAAPVAQQVRFQSASPAQSLQGSQRYSGRGSGSIASGSGGSVHSSFEEAEGSDVRRILLHLCIPAAVFAGVYNVGPLVAHEKLVDSKGKVDRRKLLMASGLAAGLAFVIARLVI